jgi:hypothetical protein
MVFAVSSGEYRGPASPPLTARNARRRSSAGRPACARRCNGPGAVEQRHHYHIVARGELSAGGGQVYVVTYDNHLYAFGIPLEH